ncbi:hypothetical protein ACHAXA_004152 [Cyclostephanos tholiformis]|uniref:Uncharacterized protein n=1 Tax=Cyclostephanos tholiformis TaxID=382380 RepID=A0ABD3R7C1_9STRA
MSSNNPNDESVVICLSDDDDDDDAARGGVGENQKDDVEDDGGGGGDGGLLHPRDRRRQMKYEGGKIDGVCHSSSPSGGGEGGSKYNGIGEHDGDDDDDDVEVVDGESRAIDRPLRVAHARSTTAFGVYDDDEELVILGTHNEQRLPHNRQDCLDCRYVDVDRGNNNRDGGDDDDNARYCELCYCYVCDAPASECIDWFMGRRGTGDGRPVPSTTADENDINAIASASTSTKDDDYDTPAPPPPPSSSPSDVLGNDGGGHSGKMAGDAVVNGNNDEKVDTTERRLLLQPHRNHCHATNRGTKGAFWRNMRAAVKDGRDPSLVPSESSTSYASNDDDGLGLWMANYVSVPSFGVMAAALVSRPRIFPHWNIRRVGGDDGGVYGSTTLEAAAAATASVAPTAPARGRRRTGGGGRGGNKRPALHDHRDRIRTQRMLEDLYG